MRIKKGFPVELFLVVMLLQASCSCRATSSKMINISHSHHCSTEECLIGAEMETEELFMESEISRRLLQQSSGGGTVTGSTSNPNQPATPCGQPRYGSCLPKPNAPPRNRQNCGIYNRENPC